MASPPCGREKVGRKLTLRIAVQSLTVVLFNIYQLYRVSALRVRGEHVKMGSMHLAARTYGSLGTY